MKSFRLQFIYYITAGAVASVVLGGCASRRAAKTVTVSPEALVLLPDTANRVDMDFTIHVPEGYLSKRARLVITPQLVVNRTVCDEYTPLVVDAPVYSKKVSRREALDEDYTDRYATLRRKQEKRRRAFDLPYRQTVTLPGGIDVARIRAVISEDGCGQCTGIDTVDLASVSNPITLMPEPEESVDVVWMEPEFVIRPKIREGRGEARLQFAINKHDIRPDMGRNRAELDTMAATLGPILADSLATVNSIDIYGMASADGSFAFNTTLARNRAASARRWLVDSLHITPAVQRLIKVGSRPEGWGPVLAAMTADGHPDSTAVKRILETYTEGNDDVQEAHIRRLACWPVIRAKYLQKDRKVEYIYTYTMKSFTEDDELIAMYRTRPDAFNEDELLRVAALARTDADRMQVYRTIQHYFPQSQVAANNLAVLCLRRGDDLAARQALAEPDSLSDETLNTLAAAYIYADDYQRAVELLQEVELPQARYNLGLLKARQRRLDEAYSLLSPYKDLNSAIVALSVDRNDEAAAIMDSLDNRSPLAQYVRCLTAARLGDADTLFRLLPEACADPRLRTRAADEPDFDPYRADSRFRQALNEQ